MWPKLRSIEHASAQVEPQRGKRFIFSWKRARGGQSLIIIALAFVALLAFVGLVTDIGSLYVTYTQLKRAVDAAAVAAANNIKYPQSTAAERKQKITEAAREMLRLHHISGVQSLQVYLCSDSNLPADFAAMCPSAGQSPRKLAYVQATHNSPVYFLRLFGVQSIPFTTSAVGEAAAVDLVLVFDVSESMGKDTPGYNPRDFDPSACNAANNCQPLRDAKDAAKTLIKNLFDGYDQVSIVTFDYDAEVVFPLSADIGDDDGQDDGDAFSAIDLFVRLHDDAPAALLPWTGESPAPGGGYRRFNPIYPEDRDGDGLDADPQAPCTDLNFDLWDDNTGDPCDRDDILDTYDWNRDGFHNEADHAIAPSNRERYSLLSTCTGCGIRMGTNVLKANGRPASVWVMVFLSDGVANLSDTHATYSAIPSRFRYGFCGDNPATSFWSSYCIDRNTGFSAGRYCLDQNAAQCPPGSTHTTDSGPYSVEDYAYDMIDAAALLKSTNPQEPLGEDIIIYSIGLGAASAGEPLLRYMANVGDDGDRANDPCAGKPPLQSCGNYYYAPDTPYLNQIFENIATRIFTKISR